MSYEIRYSPRFEKSISKLKKKDPPFYQQVRKKIAEIIDNPEHFKPLRKPKSSYRRAHVGSIVIIYALRDNIITIISLDHHDKAY